MKNREHDPTLITHEVVVDGKPYTMCFDYDSLAAAEMEIVAFDPDVCILRALPQPHLMANAKILFAASIRRFHPEISYEKAKSLVTFATALPVGMAVMQAWNKAIPEQDRTPENPPQPDK